MTSIFARKLRLRPSILTLFVLLTVPVFFTIIAVTYLSNDTIARSNAEELVERFRVEAVEDIRNVFDPIKSLVRSAAVVGDEQPGFYSDNRSLRYLLSILLHNERIVSVYAGMADGSFRQARRIDPTVEIQGKPPPDGVKYAYRWIEPPKGSTRSTTMPSSTPARKSSRGRTRRRPTTRARASGTGLPRGKIPWSSPIPMFSRRWG
jgi:adenylate cyclase